jgi:hypothetical protein
MRPFCMPVWRYFLVETEACWSRAETLDREVCCACPRLASESGSAYPASRTVVPVCRLTITPGRPILNPASSLCAALSEKSLVALEIPWLTKLVSSARALSDLDDSEPSPPPAPSSPATMPLVQTSFPEAADAPVAVYTLTLISPPDHRLTSALLGELGQALDAVERDWWQRREAFKEAQAKLDKSQRAKGPGTVGGAVIIRGEGEKFFSNGASRDAGEDRLLSVKRQSSSFSSLTYVTTPFDVWQASPTRTRSRTQPSTRPSRTML